MARVRRAVRTNFNARRLPCWTTCLARRHGGRRNSLLVRPQLSLSADEYRSSLTDRSGLREALSLSPNHYSCFCLPTPRLALAPLVLFLLKHPLEKETSCSQNSSNSLPSAP